MEQNSAEITNSFTSQSVINEDYLAKLYDFVVNAPLPLHWINGSGIIVWANKAELEMLGYSAEEYMNTHISFIHADKHIAEDMLAKLSKGETLINYLARLRCKNGVVKHVLINSNVALKEGKFSHTRCYTTDITEFKKEELKTKTELARLQDTNTRLLWKTSGHRVSDQFNRIFNKGSR
jgi:two-component system, OmpR family, sensor histidine kinase VicK